MEMMENIKLLLGIDDTLQDRVLEIIINNTKSHLKILLDKEDIPEKLNFIIEEISIRRFNRIGTEGMKSESVEGHNITFYDLKDDFVPYIDIINDEKDNDGGKGRGKVMFI